MSLLALDAFKTHTGEFWPFLLVIIAGVIPTEIWRLAAVFLSSGFDENDEIIIWVRHVATALLMAVVAKLVISPTGVLETVSGLTRGISFAAGTIGFFLFGRTVLIAILCGEGVLMLALWFKL